MTEYTSEENKELVETIKGPRFYRLTLWGYGGESAYINLTKEAYEFWHAHTEEYHDNDLVQYLVNDDEDDAEYSDLTEIPKEADFLRVMDDPNDTWKTPWYEAEKEFCHQNGIEYTNARIEVEEVDSGEYMSKHIQTVEFENDDLCEVINKLESDSNYELELTSGGDGYEWNDMGKYVLQMYSAEKGTFFDAIIETTGDFDPKKLKVHINEYPNGEDIVDGMEYNGVELDNQGGDTNGKGYSAHIWINEQAK
jgi:hypothetical protein